MGASNNGIPNMYLSVITIANHTGTTELIFAMSSSDGRRYAVNESILVLLIGEVRGSCYDKSELTIEDGLMETLLSRRE